MEIIPLNIALVKHITDKELFDRISEDGCDFESYSPPTDCVYLGLIKNDSIIGYWVIKSENSVTLDIHCNILERYREHSVEAGNHFFNYIFDKYPVIKKLNCKIPVTFKDVYHYAKKFGLKDEGIDRKSYIKNGEIIDRHILGLTREDWK